MGLSWSPAPSGTLCTRDPWSFPRKLPLVSCPWRGGCPAWRPATERRALAWIPFLNEAGTIREWAEKEAEALTHWTKMEAQVKSARSQVMAIRKKALEDVSRLGWSQDDILQAMRLEAEDRRERAIQKAQAAPTVSVGAYAVRCTGCGASPGSPCKGQPVGTVHGVRAALAVAAGKDVR